ncbi:MAG: hypothetical protein ACODAF_07070 [Actinomycetota bacterium]
MAGKIVFAKKTVAVGKTTVRNGEAWDADAELVRTHPHLFDEQPAKVRTGSARSSRRVPVVETATRAPGEQRRTPRKRAARKTAAAEPEAESGGGADAVES